MTPQTTKLSQLPGGEKAIIAVLFVASMTQCMGAAAIAPAMPLMSADFPEVSATVMQLVITLPALSLTVFGLAVGTLADRLGKAVTLIAGSLVFTLTGCAAAFLNSIVPILACRFLLGIGIAGQAVAVTAILSERYHGALRTRLLALQSAFGGLGIFVLEASGGALAGISWRASFLIYLIGLVVFLGAVFALLPAMRRNPAGLPAQAEESEQAACATQLDRRGVVIAVTGACLAIFIFEALNFAVPGKLPYLITERGGSSAISGLFLGSNGLATTAFAILQGRLIQRFSRSTVLAAGFAAFALGFLGLWALDGLPVTFLCSVVAGAGQGLVMPAALQWASSATTPSTSGKVMGVYNACFYSSGFFSSLLLEPIQQAAGSLGGLFALYGVVAVGAVVLTLACRRLVNRAR